MRQANAQIGVAIANRLPNITLSGNVGSQALAMSQLFSPQTALWTIAGNLAQPIFNAGTLKNKQIAAEETFNQVAEIYRGVVLTAFQNVADALRALQSDSKAVAAATAAERAAARSFELTQKQIERGQYSVQTLLTAQQAFLQTSIARVQSEAQLLSDTVLLFQALGGGWWNRPRARAGGRRRRDRHRTRAKTRRHKMKRVLNLSRCRQLLLAASGSGRGLRCAAARRKSEQRQGRRRADASAASGAGRDCANSR